MTVWRIQLVHRTPDHPGYDTDEDGANLDDGSGVLADYRKGWADAWSYIGGNAEPGDTVHVLGPPDESQGP